MGSSSTTRTETVSIQAGGVNLHGLLRLPGDTRAIILFAHGSGSSRLRPRNTFVAEHLGQAGFGTLLFDLLTEQEEQVDDTVELRFDVPLLSARLIASTKWTLSQPHLQGLTVGYFGASTGAAAALAAAAQLPEVAAVVSRAGRPDLAGPMLSRVRAATLLIVGGNDPQALTLNRHALQELRCERQMAVVPGATHFFAEPGALAQIATLATAWFSRHAVVQSPRPPVPQLEVAGNGLPRIIDKPLRHSGQG